jgi:membrane-associated phospholipid phosphatase
VERPGKLARFTPLRRASSLRLALLYSLGPLVWVVAIVTVASAVHHGDSVAIALLILVGSCGLSLAILLPMRWLRLRRERKV